MYDYLFKNWFGTHGPVLRYYCYTHEELKEAAQNSQFCIMIDKSETQGLAALEIMATNCPLFVLDYKQFHTNGKTFQGATSVCSWKEGVCGMKSSWEKLSEDFPKFIENLPNYRPREFVENNYTFEICAKKLIEIGKNS